MQPISPPAFFKIPEPGWAPPTAEAQAARLDAQVEEFASLLYAQMFQQMREAAQGEDGEGGLFSGNAAMFAHFFDQQVGKAFASAEGNGLKEALRQQLSKTLEAQSKAKGDDQ